MPRFARLLAASGAAVMLGGLAVAGPWSSTESAAALSTGYASGGSGIDVLPSELVAAFGTTADPATVAAATETYARPASYWKAVEADVAGYALSDAERATLTAGASSFAVPASSGAMLAMNGMAVAGTATLGFQLGTAGARLMGYDPAGLACSYDGGTGWASFLYGQSASSCATAWQTASPGWKANGDVTSTGVTGWYGGKNTATIDTGTQSSTHAFTAVVAGQKITVTGHLTAVRAGTTAGIGFGSTIFWCKNTSTGAKSMSGGIQMSFNDGTGSLYDGDLTKAQTIDGSASYTCQSGTVPYAWTTSSSTWTGGSDADGVPTSTTIYGGVSYFPKVWFDTSAPNYYQAQTPNPARNWRCSIFGDNGQWYSKDSASFTDTDATKPAVDCPTLPAGVKPSQGKVDELTAGGGTKSVVPAQTVNPGKYPDCGNARCLLTLKRNGISCFSGIDCAGWVNDSKASAPAYRWECDYGPHVVDLTECTGVYAHRFEHPATDVDAGKLSDPSGKALPNTSTDAGTSTGTKTGTDPNAEPSTPGGISPDGNDCWGQAITSNPLTWVTGPVECALQWAFIPRPSATAGLKTKLDGAIAGTMLGQVGGVVNGLVLPFASIGPTGCKGPPLRFLAFGVDKTIYPMDACAEPLAGTASFINGALAFSAVMLSGLACVRYIAGVVGFVGFGMSARGSDLPEHPEKVAVTS